MSILNKIIIPVSIISLALILTCFDTKRNNPFDPNSPNNPYYGHPIMIDKIGYNFGNVAVGEWSDPVSFKILNKTSNPVYINRIESTDPAVFQVLSISPVLPSDLAADAIISFEVEFHPNAEGQFSETIDVIYENADGPRISMPVTGFGLPGTISNYQFYVRPAASGGNDTNPGTATQPFATISKAVEAALPGNKVAVAKGTYNNGGNDIELAGEELYGGFPDDGVWDDAQRDTENNPTIINDTHTSGGEMNNPLCVIKVNGNTSSPTIIDGFQINGGTGSYTSGIKINTETEYGYQLIIRNNSINGGGTYTTIENRGISLYNSTSNSKTYNIEISANSINGGTSSSISTGLHLESMTSGDTLNIKLYNNTIDGGSPTGISNNTYGIYCGGISPSIFNNTIDGGNALPATGFSYGIYLVMSSNPKIVNNIIFISGGIDQYGIYEQDDSSDPDEVDNNDVFDCLDALYYDFDTSDNMFFISSGTFMGGSQLTTPTGYGNINEVAYFVNQAGGNWHLFLPDPENEIIRVSGKTLNEFTTDKDGNTRTVPWSIGAYEHD